MLSRNLFWEPTPPGGVRPGEQVLPGPWLHNEHAHLYRKTIATRSASERAADVLEIC
jgi:hypothetical protein